MVYGRYIYTIPMVYKPTFTSLGGYQVPRFRTWDSNLTNPKVVEPPSIPGAVPDPEAGGGNIGRSIKSEGEMEDVPMVNLWLTDG